MERTKGEWKVLTESNGELWIESGKTIIAQVSAYDYSNPNKVEQSPETKANAQFICLAVNNHDKLVEALQNFTMLNKAHYKDIAGFIENSEQLLTSIKTK